MPRGYKVFVEENWDIPRLHLHLEGRVLFESDPLSWRWSDEIDTLTKKQRILMSNLRLKTRAVRLK